jgi:hypothetical protein
MDRDKKIKGILDNLHFFVLNYKKKLFCQTVFENSFRFTIV